MYLKDLKNIKIVQTSEEFCLKYQKWWVGSHQNVWRITKRMQSIIVKWVTNVNIEEQIYTQVDGPLKCLYSPKKGQNA